MACLILDKEAKNLVHESYAVDTRDHEDHTFCGVMFNMNVKNDLPINYIQVDALWVRGALGPMTVWVIDGSFEEHHEDMEAWTCVYEREHEPSMNELVRLEFANPVQLQPGRTFGWYVHSKLPGDEGIVYDNQRGHSTHADDFIELLPGLAHLSNRPFSGRGMWWAAWRELVMSSSSNRISITIPKVRHNRSR